MNAILEGEGSFFLKRGTLRVLGDAGTTSTEFEQVRFETFYRVIFLRATLR
jgi:hypothetical protein